MSKVNTVHEESNRKIAEALFGKSLDGFCICAESGYRIRDRDFDSREEAQRFIDSEDEQLQERDKSTAHGVNIQPCVKSHPNLYRDEAANAMLLEAMRAQTVVRIYLGTHCTIMLGESANPMISHADRKTAVCAAFCAWKGIE